MDSFTELGLNENLVNALKILNITIPTKIQQQAIPKILEGNDVFAHSETGSGKTLCYLLPILQNLNLDDGVKNVQAIILMPTHELAAQVNRVCESIIKASASNEKIRSALIIGGASMARQLEKLKLKPQIIIGSSGRVLELIQAKKIRMHTVKSIVIDEADRMLDPINIETLSAIVKTTLKDRQILMFSATKDNRTDKQAKDLSGKLVNVSAQKNNSNANANNNGSNTVSATIEHIYVQSVFRDKLEMLRKIIAAENPKSALVFLNKSDDMNTICLKLAHHNLKVGSICGEALKTERRIAIEDFRSQKIQILLSSDLSARGLDFPDVTHVINLSIPEDPLIYLHRCGRTGRNGNAGKCISIITGSEISIISKIGKKLKISFSENTVEFGKLQAISDKKKSIKKSNVQALNAKK